MNQVERFLLGDLLGTLDKAHIEILTRMFREPAGIPTTSVPPKTLECFRQRLKSTLAFDDDRGLMRFRSAETAALLGAILADVAARDGPAAVNDQSTAVGEIKALQARGDHADALKHFQRNGGIFFIHFFGNEPCRQVLDGFPEQMRRRENVLVCASAMYALKSGNVSRARYLVGQRFGPEAQELKPVLDSPNRFPLEFRLFRFLMAMYEDVAITDSMRVQLFETLGEVPLDDHLQRGSFYNAMLEVLVRRREFDTATEVAKRARYHYGQADAHLLVFYVDLYQAILSLLRGAPTSAGHHIRDAGEALALVPFESHSDKRILGLLKAVISYEQGDIQPLVRFLNEEFDELAYGEMWQTVAELAINYGGQAISRHVAIPAARAFLGRWRVQEWRSNRFRLIITLREVAILQGGNRWQEAADLLTAVQSRINRTWVEGAVDNLIRLVDQQEIAMALAWIRHLVWEVPERPLLRDQIEEFLRNDHLSERQRIALLLWSASLARHNRDMTTARSAVLKALETAARLGAIMPLIDEIQLVRILLDDTRIREFVMTSGEARQIVRKIRSLDTPASDGPERAGLTRQEIKVLLLAVSGGTNKHIARQLGLSEVTVKFHLSHIYRKIGCRKRSEAVATAKTLGWVA